MAKNSENVVDGFLIKDADLLEEARKEADGVRFMKARMDLQHPEQVLEIYKKMIEKEMFHTAVGESYLRDLQEYLYTKPQIPSGQIPPIPVGNEIRISDAAGTTDALRAEARKSKRAFHWSFAVNLVAAVVIAVMFFIALSSDSPTVLNYETKLIDKYSAWEQQLDERERVIQEKERTLSYGDED